MAETKHEILEYHGREMKVEPTNMRLADVVQRLDGDGLPVVVNLEPGDATRYVLLLTPCWSTWMQNELGCFGIPSDDSWMLVTKVDQSGPMASVWIPLEGGELGLWNVEKLSNKNKWTATILRWWLEELRLAIIELREQDNP